MNPQHLCLIVLLSCLLIALPTTATADAPLGAPDATFLIESEVLGGNQSNNLGPAAKWVLNHFWEEGECPEGDNYGFCDTLRLGVATYADANCLPGAEIHFAPKEDGGALVRNFIGSNNTGSLCNDPTIRPLADGLYDLRDQSFPGLSTADDTTKDSWFEHPHLTLAIISSLPQSNSSTAGNQIRRSLDAACELAAGQAGEIPAMPVWTMVARLHTDEAVPFARLLSAAGGTGTCCDTYDDPGCDPEYPAEQLDVCAHISDRQDAVLRTDLMAGRYRCASAVDSWQTGALDFETTGNNLPQITCHLTGMGPGRGDNTNVCEQSGRLATDLLGKFACMRQLPRHATAGESTVELCDATECRTLSEKNGDFEYVDENKTLIALTGASCDSVASGAGQVTVDSCPMRGEPCDTGAPGRCADGFMDCDDGGNPYCYQLRDPMPEICNGLDDSCDGSIDNTAPTLEEIPEARQGQACHGQSTCACPDGPEKAHYGHDMMTFLDGQEGLCHCILPQSYDETSQGGAYDEDFSAQSANEPSPTESSSAGCNTTGKDTSAAGLWLLLLVLGLSLLRLRLVPRDREPWC